MKRNTILLDRMRMVVFPFLRPGLCSVSFFQFVFSRSRCAETKGMTSTCKHSGAGRDNPLLNGPPEGRVHSSRGPCCGTSLLHLLQPLNVQRGVHTCWSHGGRLPSLPGSNLHRYVPKHFSFVSQKFGEFSLVLKK